MVYSIISAKYSKIYKLTTYLKLKINGKLLLIVIKQYTLNLILLVVQINLLI